MQEQTALDTFGRVLMTRVRDSVLNIGDKFLEGKMKAPGDQDLQERLKKLDEQEEAIIKDFVTVMVDQTIHHVMWMFETEGNLDISVSLDNGNVNLSEVSDGLAGELYTEDGWIARFSCKPSLL